MSELVFATDALVGAYVHSTGPGLGRFLSGLRERVILGRECRYCGEVVVPADDLCDACGNQLFEFHEVGPGGRVTGVAIVHETPLRDAWLEPPYAVVRVRLDGASIDLLHVCHDVTVRPGDRVHAVWASQRSGSIRDLHGFALGGGPAHVVNRDEADVEPTVDVARELRVPVRRSLGEVTSRFHAEVRAGRLMATVCPACGARYLPPRSTCPRCWIACAGWQPVADVGTVVSFTVVNVAFGVQELEIPYVLAQVLLDHADTTIDHVIAAPTARIGDRVRAVWRPAAQRTGYVNDDIVHFEPLHEG